MANEASFLYDPRRRVGSAKIGGRIVKFRGSQEGAEKFFAGLARAEKDGLLYTEGTLASMTIKGPRR